MAHNRPRILVTAPMEHLTEATAILEEAGEVTYCAYPSDEELCRIIGDYDAIVPNLRQVIDRSVIDAATDLKVIATPSTGTDHIDLAYAESRGIVVQSIKRDYDVLKNITATAEHAFMLMIACLRRLPFAFDAVREGSWYKDPFYGREVQGRVYGIVGYGRLGEMVSRYAHAFGMPVLACDPYKPISDPWVRQVDFETLLRESEIITLHIHLTEETEGLIGEREFSLMREGVYLVNTSRGKIIDEAAFVRALASGRVACAGVDVIATELEGEIAANPLVAYAREHSNLIITPHLGGFTLDSQQKAYVQTARKLIRELETRSAG